jgi:hypothetical protein
MLIKTPERSGAVLLATTVAGLEPETAGTARRKPPLPSGSPDCILVAPEAYTKPRSTLVASLDQKNNNPAQMAVVRHRRLKNQDH